MQVVPVLVACALSVLAGCVTPSTGGNGAASALPPRAWVPHACDPTGATSVSANAPLVAPLNATPAQIASRFAQAVGDPVVSSQPDPDRSDARASLWPTRGGGDVTYPHDSGWPAAFSQVSYAGRSGIAGETAAQAQRATEGVLGRMGLRVSELDLAFTNTNPSGDVHLWFAQRHADEPLQLTGGTFSFGRHIDTFTLNPLYDLSRASASVTPAEARKTAEQWARCVLDEDGRTARAGYNHLRTESSGFAIAHESLGRVVTVTFSEPAGQESHCGTQKSVIVDATTGAVLGTLPFLCD